MISACEISLNLAQSRSGLFSQMALARRCDRCELLAGAIFHFDLISVLMFWYRIALPSTARNGNLMKVDEVKIACLCTWFCWFD